MHACTHIIKESKSSNDGKIDYGPRGKVVEKKKRNAQNTNKTR